MFISALALIFPAALPCRAQTIVLKTGQSVPARNLRRDGQTLMNTVDVAGQTGQVGYAVNTIDRLELPKPPQLDQAAQSLSTGKSAEALAAVEPVVTSFYPLRDIKGGYWAQAALLKAAALQALNRRDEAAALLTSLSEYPGDKALATTAKARLAGLLALGGSAKAAQAGALADAIINSSEDSAALGEAWLAKGRALYAQEDYEGALLAFLHLPVFYNDNAAANPPALLGSGRCYLALKDGRRAARTFLEIQQQYAASPEAAEAKREIEKGGETMARLVKEAQEDQAASAKSLDAEKGKPAKRS